MSARKLLPLSATKTAPNANSTLRKDYQNSSRMFGSATKSSNLSQLNSTVCSIKSTLPAYVPQDTSFEVDCAYSEYLKALTMKDLSENVLSQDKIAWDASLCEKNNVLINKEKELMQLQQRYQINEIKITSDNLYASLKLVLDKLLGGMESNNIPEKVDNINKVLNESCNKLELENIITITTLPEYEKLSQTIESYVQILKSLQVNNDESTALNHLSEQLLKCIDLFNDVQLNNVNLKSSTRDYIHLLYKTLSDAFAYETKNRKLYTF